MLCGHPASGKTRRAQQLIEYIMANHAGSTIHHVCDESLKLVRNEAYAGAGTECFPVVF